VAAKTNELGRYTSRRVTLTMRNRPNRLWLPMYGWQNVKLMLGNPGGSLEANAVNPMQVVGSPGMLAGA